MPGPTVRLRAPAGVGAVQTLSGRHLNVAANGTVEMSQSDAAPLLSAGWEKVRTRPDETGSGFVR
jgi:hypothetical protein